MSTVGGRDATTPQRHPRYRPRNMPVRTEGVEVALARTFNGDPTKDLISVTTRDRATGDIQQQLLFTQAQALHIARVAVQLTEPEGDATLITWDAAYGAIDDCSRKLRDLQEQSQQAADRDRVLREAGYLAVTYATAGPPLQKLVDLILEARK